MFLLNPVFALEEAGFDLNEEMRGHILHGLRFGARAKARIRELDEAVRDVAGRPVDALSDEQVSRLLFVELKIPLPGPAADKGTGTRKAKSPEPPPPVSEELLDAVKDRHRVVPLLIELRRQLKGGWRFVDRETYEKSGPRRVTPQSGASVSASTPRTRTETPGRRRAMSLTGGYEAHSSCARKSSETSFSRPGDRARIPTRSARTAPSRDTPPNQSSRSPRRACRRVLDLRSTPPAGRRPDFSCADIQVTVDNAPAPGINPIAFPAHSTSRPRCRPCRMRRETGNWSSTWRDCPTAGSPWRCRPIRLLP